MPAPLWGLFSMNLFELTRALIDIDSTTGREREIGEFLFRHLEDLARTSRRRGRADAGRGGALQRPRRLGRAGGGPLDPHGYGAAVLPLLGGRGLHPRPGGVRHQGGYRRHAPGRPGSPGGGGARLRSALRGRRGDGQRRRPGGEPAPPGIALPDQRRAHGEPARPRLARGSSTCGSKPRGGPPIPPIRSSGTRRSTSSWTSWRDCGPCRSPPIPSSARRRSTSAPSPAAGPRTWSPIRPRPR